MIKDAMSKAGINLIPRPVSQQSFVIGHRREQPVLAVEGRGGIERQPFDLCGVGGFMVAPLLAVGVLELGDAFEGVRIVSPARGF